MFLKTTSELRKFFSFDILFIYFFIFTLGLSSSIVIPILTDLDTHFTKSLQILSFTLNMSTIEAIFIAISTLSLFFWGYLIDKYSRKKYLIFGNIIAIFGVIVILVFSTTIELYFLGRCFFVGVGLGVLTPVAYSYAGDVIDFKSRSALSGGISVVGIISSGFGILISGFLSQIYLFLPFFILLLLFCIIIIITGIYQEPLRGRNEPEIRSMLENKNFNEVDIKASSNEFSHNVTFSSLFSLFKKKTNLLMFLQGFFALIPSVIFSFYLIAFIHDDRFGGLGFPLEYAIIMAMGPASGRIFGYIFFGYLGDYFQDKPSILAGRGRAFVASITMLVQGPVMILVFLIPLPKFIDSSSEFIFSNQWFLLFGIMFFIGAFIGGGSGPNRRSITFDINEPELRGQASSIFSIGDSFGASFGLLIGNFIIIQSGYLSAFTVLSLSYIIASIFWFLTLFTVENDEQNLRMVVKKRLNRE